MPDPPSNLSVTVRNGKTAVISWSPPLLGSYSSFKLKISALTSTSDNKPQTFNIENIDSSPYILRELSPGVSYQVQAFTIFENKESVAYTSRNFTTSKLIPSNFVFFLFTKLFFAFF